MHVPDFEKLYKKEFAWIKYEFVNLIQTGKFGVAFAFEWLPKFTGILFQVTSGDKYCSTAAKLGLFFIKYQEK